ncbi:MAG: protein kinase [Myxococcales bacterium]|nr:protein kinase [Myxococcales bacterium]
MDSPDDDGDDIAARARGLARTHAAHSAAFTHAPDRSIRRSELAQPGGAGQQAQAAPRLPKAEALRMGPTLGAGGMGIVRAAEQLSLGRQVAVKSLQDEAQGEEATLMLLQEAIIMGRLEHPNILPIHDLQFDEGGVPQLVLKHIEGVEWGALMGDAAAIEAKLGEQDLLEWNIRVLMQVCNAIHFAHSRGIIHRDLKPPNVMIGSFGEVYVMDWGLALSMEEDEEGFLPFIDDAVQLAGTPQYMAPEMLGNQEFDMGPLTDVYLLGAILYEIIAGRPPHAGESIEAMMESVLRSAPPMPPEAPPELADICTRAMDPDPRQRFDSALQLRLALQRFLEHTGSRRLEAQASGHAQELATRIAEEDAGQAQRLAQIQELFGQCRFAYRQALEQWPENGEAWQGLRDVTAAMIDHELGNDNARGAAQLLATLSEPDAALRARVEAALLAERERAEHVRDLERYQRATDIRTGSRRRGIVAGILGLSWTLAPLVGHFAMVPPENDPLERLSPSLFAGAVLLVMAVVVRLGLSQVLESRLTQHLLGGMTVAMFALPALEGAGWALQLSIPQVQALWPLTWFCVSAMLAITVDWRMAPMTLGFLGALVASVLWPQYRFLAMTASNFVMTINMFTIWMRPAQEDDLPLLEEIRKNLRRGSRRARNN